MQSNLYAEPEGTYGPLLRTHAEKLDIGRLKLPAGFHIAIFAEAPHARMLVFSPGGTLLVSETEDGKVVAMVDPKQSGHPQRTVTVADELNAPHGMALHNGKLYVAEINQVRRYDWDESQLRATNGQVIAQLPGSGGGHSTRTLLFANGKMYVATGSSCNVCIEQDKRRAAVMEFNDDGGGQRIFASGLRNAVGIAVNPTAATGWGTIFRRKKSTTWEKMAVTSGGHTAMAAKCRIVLRAKTTTALKRLLRRLRSRRTPRR